ncbi:MAG: glycosyltransferase family 9 protein [Candidatus Krumholzibacteria bacterium]|jgi:lipopolysaccharide heptosyltransferase II|nr:glycosyltransferase family 9 protein [Candidatus Krumholzibacteria bacterium]MDP7020834.1 glycosyltransferase family 9 protein [Candidatus Krumholzibacteria bacterium]
MMRILVMRFREMGDVILSLPLLDRLREAYPEAEIDFLVQDSLVPLIEGYPALDRILAWPRSPRYRFLSDLRWALKIRSRHYDLLLDLHGNLSSVAFTALSGARLRIGYHFRHRHYFYTHKFDRVWPGERPHPYIPFHHLRLLEPLGLQPGEAHSHLPKKPGLWERKNFGVWDAPVVLLAPGATWSSKQWPASYYAELSRHLAGDGFEVFLMGSALEQPLLATISQASSARVLPLVDLPTMVEIVRSADSLIATDSGARHVAYVTDTPSLGIYGPGDSELFSPDDPLYPVMKLNLDCVPCTLTQCPLQGHPCMKDLKPEMVFDKFLRWKKEVEEHA